jgi:nucleotide-binding universal stress UspA family protein
VYKKILVPLDGSELGQQALPYVRMLGRALKSPVELYRIYEPEPVYFYPDPGNYRERMAAAEEHRKQALASLNPIRDSLQAQGIGATAMVHEPPAAPRGGHAPREFPVDPARLIVDEAGTESDTLIVMCTHGRAGVGRWVMGSVTDKVLHSATSPLWIVRARPGARPLEDVKLDSIILPLDGSALSEQIVPHAVALAKALELMIRPVRVTAGDRTDAHEADHLRQMGARLLRQGVLAVEERVLHGDPGAAIVELTEELPNALVAMTTHGRSGVGRWVLGSVTNRVVRYGAGPVLVTRSF